MDKATLAKMMDFTVLAPTTDEQQITALCDDAVKYGAASVCVQPVNITLAAELLKKSGVNVCTVAGFPLGENVTIVKAAEAERAYADGAGEIDMVACISRLKQGDNDYFMHDIRVVRMAVAKAVLKVIIETSLLSEEEIVRATTLCVRAGADFVKTSTGFSGRGASVRDIELMSEAIVQARADFKIKRPVAIKASGGIRTAADCAALVAAGASRLGVSKYADILGEI